MSLGKKGKGERERGKKRSKLSNYKGRGEAVRCTQASAPQRRNFLPKERGSRKSRDPVLFLYARNINKTTYYY